MTRCTRRTLFSYSPPPKVVTPVPVVTVVTSQRSTGSIGSGHTGHDGYVTTVDRFYRMGSTEIMDTTPPGDHEANIKVGVAGLRDGLRKTGRIPGEGVNFEAISLYAKWIDVTGDYVEK
ncbi:hypothetical protein AAG570_011233 [Ranatra chinensis]|uniref:Uncharacterized protein n=1 Tax=Ranatra chinensis TaxID=642074 RepID=A0ABD0YK94_9HEMI